MNQNTIVCLYCGMNHIPGSTIQLDHQLRMTRRTEHRILAHEMPEHVRNKPRSQSIEERLDAELDDVLSFVSLQGGASIDHDNERIIIQMPDRPNDDEQEEVWTGEIEHLRTAGQELADAYGYTVVVDTQSSADSFDLAPDSSHQTTYVVRGSDVPYLEHLSDTMTELMDDCDYGFNDISVDAQGNVLVQLDSDSLSEADNLSGERSELETREYVVDLVQRFIAEHREEYEVPADAKIRVKF